MDQILSLIKIPNEQNGHCIDVKEREKKGIQRMILASSYGHFYSSAF